MFSEQISRFARPKISIAFFFSVFNLSQEFVSFPTARAAYTRVEHRCQTFFSKKMHRKGNNRFFNDIIRGKDHRIHPPLRKNTFFVDVDECKEARRRRQYVHHSTIAKLLHKPFFFVDVDECKEARRRRRERPYGRDRRQRRS